MGDFYPQALANTAWAFATFGQANALLFMALARKAERRLGDFNARELTGMVWAFDELNIRSPKLMQKIGAAASQLIDQFGTEDLLKFRISYQRAGGKDESWARAAASQHEHMYPFPSINKPRHGS